MNGPCWLRVSPIPVTRIRAFELVGAEIAIGFGRANGGGRNMLVARKAHFLQALTAHATIAPYIPRNDASGAQITCCEADLLLQALLALQRK